MGKIEEDVARLRERVEQLEATVAHLVAGPPADAANPPSKLQYSDKAEMRRLTLRALERMGYGLPTMTPQGIREQMMREGVRPEDRVFNTTREEMRAEKGEL